MDRRTKIAIAALVAGTSVFAVMRWLKHTRDANSDLSGADQGDNVEEADLESFPASDPPSWTLGAEPPD